MPLPTFVDRMICITSMKPDGVNFAAPRLNDSGATAVVDEGAVVSAGADGSTGGGAIQQLLLCLQRLTELVDLFLLRCDLRFQLSDGVCS